MLLVGRNGVLVSRAECITFGTDAHLVLRVVLEETLDTTAGELDVGSTVSPLLG